jgi:hypothetical protein
LIVERWWIGEQGLALALLAEERQVDLLESEGHLLLDAGDVDAVHRHQPTFLRVLGAQ